MKKINLRWVVISLIVIVVFLQIFAIINGYIFLSSIANTYVNQSPLWLGFAIGLLVPLGLVSVYITSLILIKKNKIQGYKYAGLVSLIMFIQLMGPVFEGKKEFLDVSVALWPVIILGILSFLAYSKLKTEQPSEVGIKKQSNIGNFVVVILIIILIVIGLFLSKNSNDYNLGDLPNSFTIKITADLGSSGADRVYTSELIFVDGNIVSGFQTYEVGPGMCPDGKPNSQERGIGRCDYKIECILENQHWIDTINKGECKLTSFHPLTKTEIEQQIKNKELKPIKECGHNDTCFEIIK